MPDVLEFNPNRDLSFNSNRERGFDPGRPLLFDAGRDRDFHPDRDLPFGKRGVVFRGFICPICGVSVTADQPACTDCGAVFDRTPAARTPPPPAPPPIVAHKVPAHEGAPPHRPLPIREYPPAPKRIETHNCPFCGARLATSDAFCWHCGNRLYAPGR